MRLQPVVPLAVNTNCDNLTPLPYKPESFTALSDAPRQTTRDLFSPAYWDDDRDCLHYDKIKILVDDLVSSTIQLEGFGEDTFSRVAMRSEVQEFIETTGLYNDAIKRWHGFPFVCADEKELRAPMRRIIDEALDFFNHKKCIVMDSFNLSTFDSKCGADALPHFMGMGWGSNFGPMDNLFELGPSYRACTSFIELRAELDDDHQSVIKQLAHYALRCFIHQHNREFVYGLLVTEERAELYIFDRSGVCYSRPWNIHSSPTEFILMILGIWSPDLESIGFDTGIYWRHIHGTWIRHLDGHGHAGEPENFILDPPYPIYHHQQIEGRGTTCWSATDSKGRRFIVKDCWDEVEGICEAEFLSHASSVEGVGRYIVASMARTVSKIRGMDRMKPSLTKHPKRPFIDRRSCRMVLVDYGRDTIEDFGSRRELLYGLRDAIAAHQSLWVAGILHGDVRSENILLKTSTHSSSGCASVLIDMDQSSWVRPLHPNSSRSSPMRRFSMDRVSCNYLGDLWSFYDILFHICTTYAGPRMKIAAASEAISQNETFEKATDFTHIVTPYFGDIFAHLLEDLCAFFTAALTRNAEQKQSTEYFEEVDWKELEETAKRDYDAVLNMFDSAIEDLVFGRFMPVEDDELTKTMAKILQNNSQQPDGNTVPLTAQKNIPNTYVSALPSSRKRMRDEDDIGYDIPPPRPQKKQKQAIGIL